MAGRGDDVPRPIPWRVRYADRQAAQAWEHLVSQVRDAMDRAWVDMTSDPRRRCERQHQLKGEALPRHCDGQNT